MAMMNKRWLVSLMCAMCAVGLSSRTASAQCSGFEARLSVSDEGIDLENGHLYMDAEIRSCDENAVIPLANSVSFRFTFNTDALAAVPSVVFGGTDQMIKSTGVDELWFAQKYLSGVVTHDSGTTFFDDGKTTFTGSSGRFVSLNMEPVSDPYPVGRDWVRLAEIRFEIVDVMASLDFQIGGEGPDEQTVFVGQQNPDGSLGAPAEPVTFEQIFASIGEVDTAIQAGDSYHDVCMITGNNGAGMNSFDCDAVDWSQYEVDWSQYGVDGGTNPDAGTPDAGTNPDGGTNPDAGTPDGGSAPTPDDDGGCGCRVAGQSTTSASALPLWMMGAWLGLAVLWRRRRSTNVNADANANVNLGLRR